ncbi:hypothetical protein [Nodosilinea sp. FACHB-13]|uniref:hypothetical protein n=1 Tax=Cyanophyceae TaxID=3028117 RepID=UPI001686B5B6|nr:hypothetical protein [Nodosilinea sp. FACHB-13]MBD2107572.1 hypothetical protein [Nodosilinea sp. FACHB-13]
MSKQEAKPYDLFTLHGICIHPLLIHPPTHPLSHPPTHPPIYISSANHTFQRIAEITFRRLN